jgi:hypothetical protein
MPVSLLKTRWHGLLALLKQFMTFEGRFGFVFLYHLRLLMNFIGFPLNMPYYLWRSLYKMAKRYKKQCLDSSLFQHSLIKIMLAHQLKLQNDDWDSFLTRNGFTNSYVVKVDKPVIEETLVYPRLFPSSAQACVTTTHSKPLPDSKFVAQTHEQDAQPNASTKNANRPVGKPSKGDIDLSFKNKRAGRLISRKIQNKSNRHVSSIKTIEIHESLDSEIDIFMAKEDPPSFQTHLDQSYNFMDNLSACLKHSEGFLGIKFGDKSTGHIGDVLVHNRGYS